MIRRGLNTLTKKKGSRATKSEGFWMKIVHSFWHEVCFFFFFVATGLSKDSTYNEYVPSSNLLPILTLCDEEEDYRITTLINVTYTNNGLLIRVIIRTVDWEMQKL